ncbi:MAG TPA: amidase [Rhizomicrobium sp.]|nr:amidase [Rhizomicrobium sp.]
MDDTPSGQDRRTVLKMGGAAMLAMTPATTTPATGAEKMSDIVMMDAKSLSAAIAAKKLSCAEVMTATLDHIARLNPRVNAIVALQDRDRLVAQAREYDAMLAKGRRMGVLHGFPHAVKDLQPVKGIVSTSGSPLHKDFVPTADSLVVERMRAAGAIFIGKTNVPEFGLGSHTYNPVYGATHNAYDQSKSAGGSSGGAAVSLALHMLPVADGTDYGGSLRNPAGWNNVFGFRTSMGVVPAAGEDVWMPSMSVAGPMARNIPDLAMLLSTQAGYDPRAPMSLEGSGSRFLAPLETSFKGKRIGWLNDLNGAVPYEPGVLELCREALKTFEAIGCSVETTAPQASVEDAWQAFVTLRNFQQGPNFRAFYADPAKRALLKPEAVYEIEGAMKLSAFNVTDATIARTRWSNAFHHLFAQYDFLVTPTAQVFPFDINEHWPRQIAGKTMRTYHEWMVAICMVTLSGCPALAVPAGFSSSGLPMGLQIIAPVHHDLDCLKLGHAYDQASNWTARHPPALLRA